MKKSGNHDDPRESFGPEHPDTRNSLSNLASLLKAQGDLPGARPLYQRALSIREKALGSKHRLTGQNPANLASPHYAQRDLAGARKLFERAVAIYDTTLGPENPDTIFIHDNLA